MALYTVCFSCGHNEPIHLFGPYNNRYNYIKYLTSRGKCLKCRKENHQQEIDQFEQQYDLAIFVGLETQINWARSIRMSKIRQASTLIEKLYDVVETNNKLEITVTNILNEFFLKSINYWLDNRSIDGKILLKNIISSK